MSWTNENESTPQGDWGQGAANNDKGWGQAAKNLISWGMAHALSWGHAITNLVGLNAIAEGFDFYMPDWTPIDGNSPTATTRLYSANSLTFVQGNSIDFTDLTGVTITDTIGSGTFEVSGNSIIPSVGGDGDLRYLKLSNGSFYELMDGASNIVRDSGNTNNGVVTGATWTQGVDTVFNEDVNTQTAIRSWNQYDITGTTVTNGGPVIIPERLSTPGIDLNGNIIGRPFLANGFNWSSQSHYLDSGVNLGRDTSGALGIQVNNTNESYLKKSAPIILNGDVKIKIRFNSFNFISVLGASTGYFLQTRGSGQFRIAFDGQSPVTVSSGWSTSSLDTYDIERIGNQLTIKKNDLAQSTTTLSAGQTAASLTLDDLGKIGSSFTLFNFVYLKINDGTNDIHEYTSNQRQGDVIPDSIGNNDLTLTSDLATPILPQWVRSIDGVTWVADDNTEIIGGSTDMYIVGFKSLIDMPIAGDDVYNNVLTSVKLVFENNAISTALVDDTLDNTWVEIAFKTDGLGMGHIYLGGIDTPMVLIHTGAVGVAKAALSNMLYGNDTTVNDSMNGYMGKMIHYPRQLSDEAIELVRIISFNGINVIEGTGLPYVLPFTTP